MVSLHLRSIEIGRTVRQGHKEPEPCQFASTAFWRPSQGSRVTSDRSSRAGIGCGNLQKPNRISVQSLLRTNHGMPGRDRAHCGISRGISARRGARGAPHACGGLRHMPRQADGDLAAAGTNPSCGVRRGACRLPGWTRRPSAKHSQAFQMRHVPFARTVVFLDLPSPLHYRLSRLNEAAGACGGSGGWITVGFRG